MCVWVHVLMINTALKYKILAKKHSRLVSFRVEEGLSVRALHVLSRHVLSPGFKTHKSRALRANSFSQ